MKNIFSDLNAMDNEILDLRLFVLPQAFLAVYWNRQSEVREALEYSVKNIMQREKNALEQSQNTDEVVFQEQLAHIETVLEMLSTIMVDLMEDHSVLEGWLPSGKYYQTLSAMKAELRKLRAGLSDQAYGSDVQHDREAGEKIAQFQAVLAHYKSRRYLLEKWVTPKKALYNKSFEAVFSFLENTKALKSVWSDVKKYLFRKFCVSLVSSGLFYLHNAEAITAAGDSAPILAERFMEGEHVPGVTAIPFFDDEYYLSKYGEVKALRFTALEHFIKHGSRLLYSPFPEFDAEFYLRVNDDVLDAGAEPFSHFVNHGVREGRPPSKKSSRFFLSQYISPFSSSVSFFYPDGVKKAMWLRVVEEACAEMDGISICTCDKKSLGEKIQSCDVLFLDGNGLRFLFEKKILQRILEQKYIVYIGGDPQSDLLYLIDSGVRLHNLVAVTANYERYIRWQETHIPLRLVYHSLETREDTHAPIEALLSALAAGEERSGRKFLQPEEENAQEQQTRISVVSIIYKKAEEMCSFLDSLNRQDLACPYEVVLVNDASPDDAPDQIAQWLQKMRDAGLLNRHMQVRILHNETNLGNCVSRNKGIEAARAEIVLVADGDMVFNASSLMEHLWAYRFDDCDALIGFMHFNQNHEFVFNWLAACELHPGILRQAEKMGQLSGYREMRQSQNSLYNFVTRNVSFKKSSLGGRYFDEAFSYSSAPDSGYGEEDHEVGARLYFERKKIKYSSATFAIHIRHTDNSNNANKVVANLRNWNKLVAKYPLLSCVDRQHYQWRTTDLLRRAADSRQSPEYQEAYGRIAEPSRKQVVIKRSRPLKILTYRWHAAHQYELFKLGLHNFTLATNIGNPVCETWGYDQRPIPPNVTFAPLESLDLRDFDFAILPFDEHILHSENCAVLSPIWGKAFLTMLEATKNIPRVALCHGTPQIYEYEESLPPGKALGDVIEYSRDALRQLLSDVHVVCNSHQAKQEWGFAKSSVIWHGFSPMEFPQGTHTRGALTLPQKAFEQRPVYRGVPHMARALELLGNSFPIEYTRSPASHPGYTPFTQEWAVAKFQAYVRYIGEFAIYCNPTVHSPMPRSRGEAMMTGVIPVSIRSHDVDMFIENGVNGFFADSAEEMAVQMKWLMKKEAFRRSISERARQTAMDIFNIDRNMAAWSNLIAEIIG